MLFFKQFILCFLISFQWWESINLANSVALSVAVCDKAMKGNNTAKPKTRFVQIKGMSIKWNHHVRVNAQGSMLLLQYFCFFTFEILFVYFIYSYFSTKVMNESAEEWLQWRMLLVKILIRRLTLLKARMACTLCSGYEQIFFWLSANILIF